MSSALETGLRPGSRWEDATYLDTVYVTNGYDRPLEILGDGSDARPVGSDTPAVGTWANGRTNCSYKVVYGYRNGNGRWVWSNWSAAHSGNGAAGLANIPVSSEAHVTHKKIARTVASGVVYYDLVTLANATTTYTDGTTDATLQERDEIDTSEAHDRPLAKRYIVSHNGRLLLAGEDEDTLGSVAVTNGSATATGTGTYWTAAQVGKRIAVASDNISYVLNAVASTTSATLGDESGSMTYLGTTASAQPYSILGDRNRIHWSRTGEPEYFKNSGTNPQYADLPSSDLEIVGWGKAGPDLLCLTQKGIYLVDVYDDAAANIRQLDPAAGAVAHRAAVESPGNRLIWLGRENIYEYAPGRGVHPIADFISPTIRDLNQDQLNRACGCYWRKWGLILFFVAGSNETSNQTYIVGYDRVRQGGMPAWYVGEGAPVADVQSYIRAGEEEEVVAILDSGRVLELTADELDDFGELTGTQSGTLTTATTTVLTDSAAAFVTAGSGLLGLLAYVRSASTGAVQRGTIASNTATALTLSVALTTAPAVGDTYAVAPIYLKLRLGRRDVGRPGERKHWFNIGLEMANGYSGAATGDLDIFLNAASTREKTTTLALSEGWDYAHAGVRARDLDAEFRCITPGIKMSIEAARIDYTVAPAAGR